MSSEGVHDDGTSTRARADDTSTPASASLAAWPETVLVDALLPFLDARSLVRLGATSRAFRDLVFGDAAEPVWRTLLQRDLRFPVHKTVRPDQLWRG